MKYTYHYFTSQKISKKQFEAIAGKYGLVGDEVREGKTLVAYRRLKPETERDFVFNTGRF